MTIAESLNRFRSAYNLSQAKAASAAKIAQSSYSYYERTENNSIPLATVILNLANAYQVSTDYLLGLTDDPRPVNQILAESVKTQQASTPEITLESLQAQIDALKAALQAQGLKI